MPPRWGDDQTGAMPFPELERLRLFAERILCDQLTSLKHFKHSYGFKHLDDSTGVSVASSATCVLSLVATNRWTDYSNEAKTKALLKDLLDRETSADLEPWNPFTLAWVLDAVTTLEQVYPGCLDPGQRRRVKTREKKLQDEIRRGAGGVSIAPYPASAYLTQLVVACLTSAQS